MHASDLNAAGLRKPPALGPGSRIGVFAPSMPAHILTPERYKAGVAALEALGYRVVEDPLIVSGKIEGYRTAPPVDRAQALMALWTDPAVDGLMSVIGGQNSSSLLAHLDFDALAAHPKVFCGYSDVTALHMALMSRARVSTFYGPAVAPSFGEPGPLSYTVEGFTAAVSDAGGERRRLAPPKRWSRQAPRWEEPASRDPGGRVWQAHPGWTVVRGGEARGPVIAANLNTLRALAGTPFLPAFDGAILMIEDAASPLSLWERAITQLALMGVFDRVAGLIVGRPERPDRQGAPFDHTQVLLEVVGSRYSFPIIDDFDCGHTHPMLTLAQGTELSLVAEDDGGVELWVEESMVAPPMGA